MKKLSMPTRRFTFLKHLAFPLLFYFALAIFLTWPLALYFSRAVPGNAFDVWQNMWNMWWLKRALTHGENPYFTPMLYYPQGASLYLHTLNPINFLITLPFQFTLNLTAAYNAAILISLTLCGGSMYLLAFECTGHRAAALVSGIAFASSGYLLTQVAGGHSHMVAAWPLPLAILSLRRAVQKPSKWSMLLAGLAMWLNLLSDWQYFLFILIWAAWYGIWVLAAPQQVGIAQLVPPNARRSHVRWTAFVALLGTVGIALIAAAPWTIFTALEALKVPTAATEGGPLFRIEQSVDLADLFIPSQLHPLWGGVAEWLQSYKSHIHIQSKTVYLSIIALILASFGLRTEREARFWVASVIAFVILAMGPQLQIAGWHTGIPLPAAILFELPFIGIFRYPMRFIVIALIALAVLVAFGVKQIIAKLAVSGGHWSVLGRKVDVYIRTRLLLIGIVILLVLDNLTIPFPIVGIYIPSFYQEIAKETGSFAVMEAPIVSAYHPFYLLFQTIHQKPIIGGYISRRLPYHILQEIPALRVLSFSKPAPDVIKQDMAAIAPSVLHYFNIRYLILHSAGGALRYEQVVRLAEAVGKEPIYREVAFVKASDNRTASVIRRSFWLTNQESAGSASVYRMIPPHDPIPFLGIGKGWDEPRLSDGRSVNGVLEQLTWNDPLSWLDQAEVSRTITGPAQLFVYSAEPRRVRLTIRYQADQVGHLVVDQFTSDQQLTYPIQVGTQTISIETDIQSGKNIVQLIPNGSGSIKVWNIDLIVINS